MTGTFLDPTVCPDCGEPYVRQWTRLTGVTGATLTGPDGIITEARNPVINIAPVNDHHPCPAKEQQ